MRIYFFLLIFLSGFLQACAHSDVERNAADKVDGSYQSAAAWWKGTQEGDARGMYENTNQRGRGVMIGAAAGAVVGGFGGGVGLIPGIAEGAIFGGALGAYIDSRTTLVDRIKNRGVQIIVLGDQVLIVLRSVQTFNGISAKINPQAYSTLNLVAELLRGYTKMLVKVSAYTDDLGSPRINQALSQEQAESIIRYLWRVGVDTRLIYASGYGGHNLVEPSNVDWGKGANYRIEISLESLPV